jgi:predicted lipoprotein with Yx(FWY)xxD motif
MYDHQIVIIIILILKTMKKSTFGTFVLLTLVIASTTYYGCKKSDSSSTTTSSMYLVNLATDVTRGQYLVDKDGYALYFFSNDYNGRNSCGGGCAAIWPYFYAANLTAANLGSGLNIADFDTIVVNGVNQTRYKGWPLYYYAPTGTNLEPAGHITGEDIDNWIVAKPDYTIMLTNAQLVGNNGKNYLGTYVEGVGKTVYFTDAKGVTLYAFQPDSFNINKFTHADFSNNGSWPIYDTTKIVVPSVLDKTLFGSIALYGKHQLTYKGWPLYYFGSDLGLRGNNKGVSVPVPGKWPVAVKDMNPAPHK